MPRALRRTVPLASLASLALLVAGCARNLSLPPESTAPVLSALGPAAAYAGQLVRLAGTGLDPDPGANVVTFAAATARGLRFDGATLVVRVPEDAGSGPVIVTNGRGTSAPFGAFEYLGAGEPRRRALADGIAVLHAPTAVLAVGGDVLVDSAVYDGFLSSADGGFATPHADLSAAGGGALFTAELLSTTATLWRLAPAGGAPVGPRLVPFVPSALVALPSAGLLAAFSTDDGSVAAWDLATLDPVLGPTQVPGVGVYFSAADVGDGRAVAVAYDDSWSLVTLALVDFTTARGGGPLPPATLLPGGFEPPLRSHVPLATALANAPDPSGIASGEPLAAVALATGDLGVARLGPDPRFVGTVETWSPTEIAALAGAATLPVVVATKPGDDLAVGADLLARRLVWSVPGDGPGAASAAGDVALIAHSGSNDVSVVNLGNGSRIGRVSFDVGPSRGSAASAAGGLAFVARDRAAGTSEDLLFFAADRFPGLLRFSLAGRRASCVMRGAGLGPLAASPGEPALWVARSGSPASIDLLRDRGAAAPQTIALPGVAAVTDLAATGTVLALGHEGPATGTAGGMSLVGADGPAGPVPLDGFGLVGLGWAPDGRLWAVPRAAGGAAAELWDPASLGTAGVPDASRDLAASASSAAWLEDGLWVLGQGAAPEAILLGPDLAVVRTVPLAGDAPTGAVASPNGRLLVESAFAVATDQTTLRFFRADPELGFPLLDGLVLDGLVVGLTFDPTGERLWVVTRGPDRLLLVE